ncbi:DUF2341 domain-containing protein [Methanococcus maripaludis]|uniref:DUF2341 domain-containing protein n=1 Tax=Methanococcus maripaludis TaxID=39152 RepID=A0A7J9S0X1_METMI|nr:DUF2341 domain-containing protein [Methanococcus maripaludis]MBB6068121.1 hypothetical protein [Methanococcus maripaludis]MBM7409985.1 hypothetical protein [Methanococcus maripaludis]MBP2219315.1 hypothetical protein [Methanococcus maripaludis]
MTLKSKLTSKKGYIFTYEAVAVVILFIAVFYMGYFTFTHVNLTNQEQKRDMEQFEKANLISDMIFKMHEFPSNSYVPDYLRFLKAVSQRYSGLETIPGTFDPYSMNQEFIYNESWYYEINITNPGTQDLTDFQVLVTLNPSNFNFDYSSDGSGLSFWQGNTQLHYWIETWDYNDEARVWVKVDSLPDETTTQILLKRNQGGSYSSDGDDTFIFFDDFEDGNFNDNWNIVRGDWEISTDSDLSYYNGGSGTNHVAHLEASDIEYRRAVSDDPLSVVDEDIYILDALVKGHTGATGGSADSPDTMLGFYSDNGGNNYYNSFNGYDQVFAICENGDSNAVLSNIFTKDNQWYYEKLILEQEDKNVGGDENKICKASLWELFNGYLGDTNPNYNLDSMLDTTCEVTSYSSTRKHILIGTGQGSHSEEFWFDNIKVRKYAPNVLVDVYEILSYNAGQNAINVSEYHFEGVPSYTFSNVNLVDVNYSYTIVPDTYVMTRNLYVPVKTWRYSNSNSETENISSGEILYFAARRPSTISNITAKADATTTALFMVNGVPYELSLGTGDKLTDFEKVISTHAWEYYEPNEVKLLSTDPATNVDLTLNYDESSTIYVLKLKQYNVSCILSMNN